MNTSSSIGVERDEYLDLLRGASILRVMLGHLGLLWFFPPYSYYLGALLPVLFYVSGAVSMKVFLRSGLKSFALNRVIGILVPFYLFFAFIIIWGVLRGTPVDLDSQSTLQWLLTWPQRGQAYTPIQHTWYINALLVMTLLSAPLMGFIARHTLLIWSTAGIVLIYTAVFSFSEGREIQISAIGKELPGYGHQTWKVIVLMPFYLLGMHHDQLRQYLQGHRGRHLLLFSIALLVCLMVFDARGLSFDILLRQRDVCFVLMAYVLLAMLLRYQLAIEKIIFSVPGLRSLLMYTSHHAVGIFLLHIVVLSEAESLFGWSDLSHDPLLAVIRLLLVSVATLAIAPAFTNAARRLTHWFQRATLRPPQTTRPHVRPDELKIPVQKH